MRTTQTLLLKLHHVAFSHNKLGPKYSNLLQPLLGLHVSVAMNGIY